MATIESLEPAYVAWTPGASGVGFIADEYAGRHRRPERRIFSLRRLFYVARHRRR